MQKLEVGNYFFGHPRPVQEGLTLLYDAGGLTLLVSLSAMTSQEAKKIRKGRIDFAIFEKGGIMFLLANIPGVIYWSDAPFHIGLYHDDRPEPDIPEGKGLALTVIGLDANNGQIKAIRLIGLGTYISREMVRIMREQKTSPTNRIEHVLKINKIYSKYSCDQMAKEAIAKYTARGAR